MSRDTLWRCRSCGAALGQVRDGVLLPLVPIESVDAKGLARVPCPMCGRVRLWEPAGEVAPGKMRRPPH